MTTKEKRRERLIGAGLGIILAACYISIRKSVVPPGPIFSLPNGVKITIF